MRAPARPVVLVAWSLAVGLVLAGATVIPADSSVEPGPVAAALGLEVDGTSASQALERRRAAEVARRTTMCMATAGFPYVAEAEPPPPIPDGDLDPVAWARRWGFGISTSVGVAPPGEPPPVRMKPVAAEVRRALHGSPDRRGCHERATAEVYGLRDRLLARFSSSLASLRAAIDADPAMAAVSADWRGCATAASGIESAERATLGHAILEAFAARATVVQDAAALERLQAEERRVATALAVCELAYARGRALVAVVHETAFVLAHGPALEAAGAAIRAAEAAYPPDPGS